MTFADIMGALIFSAIGLGYFKYGTKTASYLPLICALFLFIYPYFCDQTWQIYVLGSFLSLIPPIFSYLRKG
jgi:hypothetical protein